jgi:hypothetical protein
MTTFFAAANSEEGFVSLFDEIFSPDSLKQIYILKGGPGSGKSTLMRSIGAEAEALGLKTEYLFCSSDTDSLDGIIIPAVAAAILDGTAPHAKDPVYPGVAERIVNLGEAFDHEALARKKSLIEAQIREKAACYRSAYRFLSAAGIMERERIALLGSVYLSEKAKAAANRLINSLRELPKGPSSHRYLSAIGTKGIVRLSAPAHKHYAVTESHGAGYLFMQALYEALTEYGYEVAKPDGAFYMFVKAPGDDANAFSEKAKQKDLLVVPGDDFGCPGYFRLCYCVEHEKILRSLPVFGSLI